MTIVSFVVVVVSAAALAYIYAGYPLLLRAAVAIRGPKPIRKSEDALPTLSLVISAYNEAAVIGEKLQNALEQDYPAGRLDITVVSDGSTDGTDEIVQAVTDPRVRLVRMQERRGKTAGLNAVIPTLPGDIIAFTDANAIFAPDALRMLARNFADPDVGCVTGDAKYVQMASVAAKGESTYWNYETHLKRLETALGSMVGGDGAIYAIRKPLWRDLPETAINDFLNPLQIVSRGWRSVFEPDAVCFEEPAGQTQREYKRRVRIVSRAWRAVCTVPQLANPFRFGWFAISLISHKVIRWFSGIFVLGFIGGTWGLVASLLGTLDAEIAGLVAIAALLVALVLERRRQAMSLMMYFIVLQAASLVGVAKGSLGAVSGTWNTPRDARATRFVRGSVVLVVLLATALALALATLQWAGPIALAQGIFVGCAALLAYVYVGYPTLLRVLASAFGRPVERGDIRPRVCLLIAAHNEVEVIEAKLQNALAIDYPRDRLDVVVVSDGSSDGTVESVRRFEDRGVRLLAYDVRRGKAAALNAAIPTIACDVLVFSDANVLLEPDAIRILVRPFADATVGAVSADVILEGERAALADSEDLYYAYERRLQVNESRLGSMIGVDGALFAIRRQLYVPPPNDTILDDVAIPMAICNRGHRVVMEPQARAHEHGSLSARQEFSRKARIVAGAIQFLSRDESRVPLSRPQVLMALLSHKVLRWLSPLFGLGVFASSVSLAWHDVFFQDVAAAELAVLVAAAIGTWQPARKLPLIGIAHYFCLMQAAAIVGLYRGILGRQPVQWRRFARGHVSAGASRSG
ncbi:MAG: glycosyltransferase family 2 protein [Vicinamibacterales bacterium]